MSHPLPKKNSQVLFTELDDGTGVLLHLETKFYFTLNRTAVVVWKAIEAVELGERATEAAVAEQLARTFRVTVEQAARDVDVLLRELADGGLTEVPPLGPDKAL